MIELCDDCAVIPFCLYVGLQVICHTFYVFNTKVVAYGSKELTDKLRSTISEEVARKAKGDDPVFEKHVFLVRC